MSHVVVTSVLLHLLLPELDPCFAVDSMFDLSHNFYLCRGTGLNFRLSIGVFRIAGPRSWGSIFFTRLGLRVCGMMGVLGGGRGDRGANGTTVSSG